LPRLVLEKTEWEMEMEKIRDGETKAGQEEHGCMEDGKWRTWDDPKRKDREEGDIKTAVSLNTAIKQRIH
jgi:hypothetical protein